MNDCDNCNPCPPCQNQVPETCEPLPVSVNPIRIVVEEADGCKGTVQQPSNPSLLQYQSGTIGWRDGSSLNDIQLPALQINTTTSADRLSVYRNDGILRLWQPSITGDKFIAYWDGTNWRIANLAAVLPAGDGVLVKQGGNLTFVNGSDGDLLQVVGGTIQFDSTVTGALPTGSIIPYPSASIPSGWVLCNGALYGRTALNIAPQPNLFAIIGTTYGSGDGLTNFAVPDLRGMFIRGLDNGRGIDPSRTIGSQQAHGFQSHNHGGATDSESLHTHSFSGSTGTESVNHTHLVVADVTVDTPLTANNYVAKSNNVPFSSPDPDYRLAGSSTIPTLGITSTPNTTHTHPINGTTSAGTPHSHTIQSEGTTETRPVNIAMNWIIKT